MGNDLRSACDGILQRTATGVPGVVAMITDRSGNIYEGAAGKRSLGGSQPMTTDSVFAIYSTSKAITGTATLTAAVLSAAELSTTGAASSSCSAASTKKASATHQQPTAK